MSKTLKIAHNNPTIVLLLLSLEYFIFFYCSSIALSFKTKHKYLQVKLSSKSSDIMNFPVGKKSAQKD